MISWKIYKMFFYNRGKPNPINLINAALVKLKNKYT